MRLQCTQYGYEFEHCQHRKFYSGDFFYAWSRGRINVGSKTVDYRQKFSLVQKGKPRLSEGFFSPERGGKISIACKGMKFSVEHRRAPSDVWVCFLERGGFHDR